MSVRFGSPEVFDRYMQEAARRNPTKAYLPLNLEDPISIEFDPYTPSSSSTSSSDPVIIDASSRNNTCFCCSHCQPRLAFSPKAIQSEPSLLLLWNKIKLSSSSSESTTAPTPEIPQTLEELPILPSIHAPENQKPSSVCSDCGESLFSMNAFSSPPGFCEYSGRLICGACFEPRQVVIPWKLVSGFSSFRGNVSRTAARLIQSAIYIPFIPTDDVIDHKNQRGSRRILAKCLQLREKIRFAKTHSKCIEIQLPGIPSHIWESDLWSLADLIDLFTPGKESVILNSLMSADSEISSHSCMRCTGTCVVCDRTVSDFAANIVRCNACGTRSHRSCLRWSMGDGCPVCFSPLA